MSRVRWSLTVAPTAITFALGALLLGGATATAEPAPTCAGGCSAGDAPKEVTAPTHEETAFILEEIAAQELGEASLELETLLFHGAETRSYLEEHGYGPLDDHQARFLTDELARTHLRVEMRVIDESGRIRAELDPTAVPSGLKQHLHFDETSDLGALEASGTVRRVGLHHIWSRW